MKVFRQLEKSFFENIRRLQIYLSQIDSDKDIAVDFSNILNIAFDDELFKVRYESSIGKEARTIKMKISNIHIII